MQFNSVDFMLFFPIVIIIYFIIPSKFREIWLLVTSYFFYMSWNATYALLIGGSTIITYGSALLIDFFSKKESRFEKERGKTILLLCILVNLGILFLFKYGNFTIDTIDNILSFLGVRIINRRLDFLLPVGISFYTFQSLGYVIDVYNKKVNVEKNLVRYSLFVSFFPQLVAGPIERSKNLLHQMREIHSIKLWNAKRVTSGAILMVWGLFMKMVIADRISIIVDTVFDNYRMFGSTELIFAAIGFSLQIYCDFCSYSTIAIGSARIIGIELMDNFNTPYFARNIRDFWSRWHISLSLWFKDYLYIPLGGNRKGKIRKYINIMTVFLISGLWHGANWGFVVWGGIHGIYQVLGDIFKPKREKIIERFSIRTDCLSWKVLQTGTTYILIVLAWIFFRANNVTDALRFFKRMITKPTPWLVFNGGLYNLGLDRVEMNILLFSVTVLFLVDLVKYKKKQDIDVFLFEQNIWFEWLVVIVLIVSIFIFGEYGPAYDAQQFLYFQF